MKRARLALTELKQDRAPRAFVFRLTACSLFVVGVLCDVPATAQQQLVIEQAKQAETSEASEAPSKSTSKASATQYDLWNPKPAVLPLKLPAPPQASHSPTLPPAHYLTDDIQYSPSRPPSWSVQTPTRSLPKQRLETATNPDSSKPPQFLLPPCCPANCERCRQAIVTTVPTDRPATIQASPIQPPQTTQNEAYASKAQPSAKPNIPQSHQSASENYAPVTQAPPLATSRPYPAPYNLHQAAPHVYSRPATGNLAQPTPLHHQASIQANESTANGDDHTTARRAAHAHAHAHAHARHAPLPTPLPPHGSHHAVAPIFHGPSVATSQVWPSSHNGPVAPAHTSPEPKTTSRTAINLQPTPGSIERATQIVVVYRVHDLVSSLEKQFEVTNEEAKQLLAYEMRRALSPDNSQFRWKNQHLVVRATSERHETYQDRLASLRSTAFQELDVAVCLATVDSESLRSHRIAWNVVALPVEKTELQPAELRSAFATTLRKQPVKSAILDAQSSAALQQKLLNTETFQLLGRPRFRLFNGRRANAEAGNQRAFVVGFENGAPQVRTFPVGWEVVVIPEIRDDTAIVRGHWTTSEILGVETVEVDDERSLQIPDLLQRQINWTHALPLGATLVIAGNRREVDGRHVESLALVRVTRANSASQESVSAHPAQQSGSPLKSGTNALTSYAPPAGVSLRTHQYSVKDLLPTNPVAQASALFDLCRRLNSAQAATQPGIAIDADLGSLAIIARHTAEGHQRIQLLLGELRAAQETNIKGSIICLSPDDLAKLTASLVNAEGRTTELGDLDAKSHLIIDVDDLKPFLTSAKPAPHAGGEDSYTWDLGDNGHVTSIVAATAGGRRFRIDAQHKRADHVVFECERELTVGREAMLIDITPPRNTMISWLEASQLFFRRESQRTRQYLVIQQFQEKKPAARSAAAR